MRIRVPALGGGLNSLYQEAQLPQDIRRSLTFILFGNIFGCMHGVICGAGTTSMIGLANLLGANDFVFGVLNGIPQAAALLQIPFSILVSRTQKRKKYMLTWGVMCRVIWMVFGFIPLVFPPDPAWLRVWSLVFLLGISSCLGAMINVCWFPWLADLAPVQIRGRWISLRDGLNSIASVVFGLIVARMLDTLPESNRYIIIFILGGAVGVMDMLCFAFAKEVYSTPPKKVKLIPIMGQMLKDKPFMRFLIFWTAWCFSTNFAGAYITRYCVSEMGITYTQITVFATMVASLATVLLISYWGRMMDLFGCRPVMMVGAFVAAISQTMFLFSTPGAVWPIWTHNLMASFWCASNLAATGMQLSLSPDDARPTYIAFFSCITALVGAALGMVSGGALLTWLQNVGWPEGVYFDRYKFVISLGVLMRIIVVLTMVPRLPNDREGTTRGLLLHMLGRKKKMF